MHQDSRECDIPTTDEAGSIPAEVAPVHGPKRRAPRYYAGESVGKHPMLYPDTERNPNGSVPGIRDKGARRIIRKAFAAIFSPVERGLRRTRALQAQAREVISNEHGKKSSSAQRHRARRLLAAELAIHQPVYAPDKKTIRAMRTAKRKAERAGKKDFITSAIERIVEKK